MSALQWIRRLIHEIATQFTDVLKRGGPVAGHIVPETAGTEVTSQRQGGAAAEHRIDAHDAADRVVQRQRAVQHVVLAEPGQHCVRPSAEEARVAESGRLRQSRGPRRVDVEQRVPGMQVGPHARRWPPRTQLCALGVEGSACGRVTHIAVVVGNPNRLGSGHRGLTAATGNCPETAI